MSENATRELLPIGHVSRSGASVVAHLSYVAAVDNRRGRAQGIEYGTAEVWQWPPRKDGWSGVEISLPGGLDLFKDGHAVRFLIAEGDTITPYYVATFHPTERNIGLKRLTPSAWDPESDGPKRTYYLHVNERKES
jgi:hypothetical protein